MKKSKIIVPALAMIGLSAVASVTGSVAWFTAQRTGQITTDKFAVVKTDGTLALSLTRGAGTIVNANGTQIDAKAGTPGATLTDASFNPVDKKLYTDADNGEGLVFTQVDNGTGYDDDEATIGTHAFHLGNNTYYAFTWTIKVSYTWSADTTDLNVFFDYANSKMEAYETVNAEDVKKEGNDIKTAKGFRIAIIGEENTIVYGGLESSAQFKGTYSTSASGIYGKNGALVSNSYSYFSNDHYAFGNIDPTGSSEDLKDVGDYSATNDADADFADREDYLCTLSNSSAVDGVSSANLICVAWFEGNDTVAINNNSALQKVKSTLAFYSTVHNAA